jgi:hypothetical protein
MGSCWRLFLHKVRLWEPRGAASRANAREPLPNHHSFTPTFGTSVPPVRGITPTKAKDLPSDLASLTRIDRDFGRQRGSVDSSLVSRTNPSPQKDLVKDCKCGTTARRRFCKQYCDTDDPLIWLTITWIPCPVHPCIHSPQKESEGCTIGIGSSAEEPLDDEETACLCTLYAQMRADPEAWEKYSDCGTSLYDPLSHQIYCSMVSRGGKYWPWPNN